MLIQLIVVLLVVGVVLWAISAFPAIDPTMKQIIRVIVILVAVLYVINVFFPGVYGVRLR